MLLKYNSVKKAPDLFFSFSRLSPSVIFKSCTQTETEREDLDLDLVYFRAHDEKGTALKRCPKVQ